MTLILTDGLYKVETVVLAQNNEDSKHSINFHLPLK